MLLKQTFTFQPQTSSNWDSFTGVSQKAKVREALTVPTGAGLTTLTKSHLPEWTAHHFELVNFSFLLHVVKYDKFRSAERYTFYT